MDGIYTGTMLFLWIAFTVVTWIIYHKIFTVYYFDIGAGLLKEIFFSAIIGALLAGLTLKFSSIVAIGIVIAGILISRKSESKAGRRLILVVFVLLAGIVFLTGNRFGKESSEEPTSLNGYENNISGETDDRVYDHNGNELYVGYVVRIGAEADASKYASGTILEIDAMGKVKVEFTEVFVVVLALN